METTNIEWCDSTINGSSGCDGCELWHENKKTCYAGITHEIRWAKSLALTHPEFYSPSFSEVRLIPGRFKKAAAWSDLRGVDRPDKPWLNGRPRHIFVGDFLSRAVPDDYLERELLAAVTSEQGRRHVWMLLTKRPARLAVLSEEWGGLPDNVIAMTTITNQAMADLRIPQLLRVRCKTRLLSIEPMLGPVNLFGWLTEGGCIAPNTPAREFLGDLCIHGMIVGGESGRDLANPAAGTVPLHPDWVRALRDQSVAASATFFFKQWGEWLPDDQRNFTTSGAITWGLVHKNGGFRCVLNKGERDWKQDTAWGEGESGTTRVGRDKAGRRLDGREHNDLPEVRT